MTSIAPRALGRVLPTLNEDGSRRLLRPRPSSGRYATARQWVAYVLMAVYLAIPHVQMNGKPLILLDAPRREFTFFGYTFLPTDTLLFMLFLGTIIITVFLLTALFGRVWCGWGCPQTVWMEFVFRPVERLIEGGAHGSAAIDRSGNRSTHRSIDWNRYAGSDMTSFYLLGIPGVNYGAGTVPVTPDERVSIPQLVIHCKVVALTIVETCGIA